MSVEIKLHRLDRVYRPPDVIDGMLVVDTPSSIAHQGVRLTATGTIVLQLSARQVGIFEALYTSVKPIELMHKVVDIQAAGKFPRGRTEERNKRLQASLDTAQKSSGTTNIMLLGLGCMQGGVTWWLYRVDPIVATKLLEELSSNSALAQTLAISPSLLGLARMMQAFLRGEGGGGGVETS